MRHSQTVGQTDYQIVRLLDSQTVTQKGCNTVSQTKRQTVIQSIRQSDSQTVSQKVIGVLVIEEHERVRQTKNKKKVLKEKGSQFERLGAYNNGAMEV